MNTDRRLPAVAMMGLGLGLLWASSAWAQFAPDPGETKPALPEGAIRHARPAPAGSVLNMRRQPPRAAPQPRPQAQPSPPAQPAPQAQPSSPQPGAHQRYSYGNPPYYRRPPVQYYPYHYVPRAYRYGYYGGYPYPVYYPPLIYNWTPFGMQRVY